MPERKRLRESEPEAFSNPFTKLTKLEREECFNLVI